MQKLGPIKYLFFPLTLGIVFGVLLEIYAALIFDSTVLFPVLLILLVILIVSHYFKKAPSWLITAIWFFLGWTIYAFHNPMNDTKYFAIADADIYEIEILHVPLSSSSQSRFIRCEANVTHALKNKVKIQTTGKIIAFIDTIEWQDFKPKDKLLVKAMPENIENMGNPGEFNVKQFWKNKGFQKQWFLGEGDFIFLQKGSANPSAFERIKQGVIAQLQRNLDGDVFAVAMGILLGDKSYLNLELKDAFSGAGAMHLLAVSGLHVGIFLVILQWLFKTFGKRIPRWLRFTFILAILWTYAGITGFSPSVNRAVTMFSFVALSSILGKRYNPLDGLLASACILLIINPSNLFDIGFQLSYLAMLGIFLFVPVLERGIYIRYKWLKFLWAGTCVALAAQLTTFPLTLYYFHQFPNYFLITNLGLMLISGVIMAVGLGLLSIGALPVLGVFIAAVFAVVVSALITFVQWVSDLPHAITTGLRIDLWEMALLYSGILLLILSLEIKNKWTLYSSLMIFLFFLGFQNFRYLSEQQTNEFIVLNNNDPMFFYRRGNQADLVVLSNKPDIEAKTAFLKRGLDVYYGLNTKLHFIERKRGTNLNSNQEFSVVTKTALVHFNLHGAWYTYIFGDYFKEEDLIETTNVILGPWVNQNMIAENYPDLSLWSLKEKGAFWVGGRK